MNGAAPRAAQLLYSPPSRWGAGPARHPALGSAWSLILRSVGNGQSLFLFVLADAWEDALARDHANPLGARDAASLAVYLAMRWPLPALLCAGADFSLSGRAAGGQCPGVFVGPYEHALRGVAVDRDWDVVAVHRWYVYFRLVARLFARLCARAGLTETPEAARRAFAGLAALFALVALAAPFGSRRGDQCAKRPTGTSWPRPGLRGISTS